LVNRSPACRTDRLLILLHNKSAFHFTKQFTAHCTYGKRKCTGAPLAWNSATRVQIRGFVRDERIKSKNLIFKAHNLQKFSSALDDSTYFKWNVKKTRQHTKAIPLSIDNTKEGKIFAELYPSLSIWAGLKPNSPLASFFFAISPVKTYFYNETLNDHSHSSSQAASKTLFISIKCRNAFRFRACFMCWI
jgi:hypothetical protein